MNEQQFKERTKNLALSIIKLVEALPKTTTAQVIGKQILRSGTSVGANYRAASRAKSTADIRPNLAIVEEETDETIYWLELLIQAEIFPEKRIHGLMLEANEILAMIVASIKTIRHKRNGDNSQSKIFYPKSKITL